MWLSAQGLRNQDSTTLKLARSDLKLKIPNQRNVLQQSAEEGTQGQYKLGVVIVVLAFMVLPNGTDSVLGQAKANREYQVKADFLYHFGQFVAWPEGAFPEANSPLVYCTVGEDPFQGALEASFKGKTIGTHSLQVKHFKEINEVQGCHVVFLGKLLKRSIPEELASLKGAPVLTVGETNQFVDDDGMIGFRLEGSKVRFEINLESAEKAHLKISAKLLAVAKRVIVG